MWATQRVVQAEGAMSMLTPCLSIMPCADLLWMMASRSGCQQWVHCLPDLFRLLLLPVPQVNPSRLTDLRSQYPS